ncbi:unnamed protein product [Cuscuta epithymum]|uniref:DUF3444 domain-containing protein n=1 Tax=Cuscuta epithymum TaxID=186058 RepID=A0AAV0G7U5_9ASTE|nr:unnamed protein product [Cuscuta epithymum]
MCSNCNKSFKAVVASRRTEDFMDSKSIDNEDEKINEISGTRTSGRIKARKMTSVGEILQRAKERSSGDLCESLNRSDGSNGGVVEGKSSRAKISKGSEEEEEEMTLAEMQMHVIKKKKQESKKRKDMQLCLGGKESEIEEEGMEGRHVKGKRERSFKRGQVWAVYSDDGDGMPRRYALIDGVLSLNPFKLRMWWLELAKSGEKNGACGRYRVSSEHALVMSSEMFSHTVDCDRVGRQLYTVYPKKGTVWAILKDEDQEQHEIVVCLSSYSEVYGLSLGYLEKVGDDGFGTVFKRRAIGVDAIRWVGKGEVDGLMSHQIVASKVSGDCWELDPSALPPPSHALLYQ